VEGSFEKETQFPPLNNPADRDLYSKIRGDGVRQRQGLVASLKGHLTLPTLG
jgi:hypothetical protein